MVEINQTEVTTDQTVVTRPRVAGITVPNLLTRAGPYLLSVLFALLALRGVDADNVISADAARHAMNGAFVHDLIRDGKLTTPVEYGKYYYSHFPALSLPYHPPLFPVVESLF